MRASSKGVEFAIQLTREDINTLESQVLKGFFNHAEDDRLNREIPFFLIYSHQDQDQMLIRGLPRGYLGSADKIFITLFDYHYTGLKETGYCGDRISSAIKVIISEIK